MFDDEGPATDPIEKRVHVLAIRMCNFYDKAVSCVPWNDRSKCLAVFYCCICVGIAFSDYACPRVSLRPFYMIPVILSALTNNHKCAISVSVFTAVAHVLDLRIALSSEEDEFLLFWNFLPTIISYLFITETVRVLTRTMSDVLAYNDALHEKLVLAEIEKERGRRGPGV